MGTDAKKLSDTIRTGRFSTGLEYDAIGDGDTTVLFLPGGPGVVRRIWKKVTKSLLRPLAAGGCTVWRLGRRLGMPTGYTIADMADDVAAVIEQDFDGHVDAVVSVSLGGLIALELAARHPDSVGCVVLIGSAARPSPAAAQEVHRYGAALAAGSYADAAEIMLEDFLPGDDLHVVRRRLGRVYSRELAASGNNRPDVLVEADAVAGFDARPDLPRITAPVLIIAGDEDREFPLDIVEDTARLIPDCWLIRYTSHDHSGIIFDRRNVGNILAFISSTTASA